MTVCIGAICNDGTTVIVASDRMVTGRYPPIEFEHTKRKIYSLTDYCAALTAGSALKPIEIITKTRSFLEQMGKSPTIEEIAEQMKQLYQLLRANEAEESILKPRTMTTELFYTKGIRVLPADLFNVIDSQFYGHDFRVEVLIGGVDTAGGHIHSIINPGMVNCYDTLGFHAIGVGYLHAIQIFISNQYDISYPLVDAVNVVYSAKKAAEVAPGVGTETDISLIFPDNISVVDPVVIKELSNIHQKVRKSPLKVIKESSKMLSQLIDKRAKEAEGKNEKQRTKQQNNKPKA